jgi:protein-tyrosine phosphatase
MAEFYARDRLAALRVHGVDVRSAGVSAMPGISMSTEAAQTLQEWGIATGGQAGSQALTQDLVDWADVIVTMTRAQLSCVRDRFPAFSGYAVQLMELVHEDSDVADPVGGTLGCYRRCLESMKPALDALVARLGRRGGEAAW